MFLLHRSTCTAGHGACQDRSACAPIAPCLQGQHLPFSAVLCRWLLMRRKCAHLQGAAVVCDRDDVGGALCELRREQRPDAHDHLDVVVRISLLLLLRLLRRLLRGQVEAWHSTALFTTQ